VFVEDEKGGQGGTEEQAAHEPGRGGCGGVPDHPPRLRAHRTSPAQALLTSRVGNILNPKRLACSRPATVACLACTGGALGAERRRVAGCELAQRSGLGVLSINPREPGGAPCQDGCVRLRAAPSLLDPVDPAAARTAGADGANKRAAPRRLEATQSAARRMAGAGAARRRVVSLLLWQAARSTARGTAGANAASW
jgi:hypothetical protein